MKKILLLLCCSLFAISSLQSKAWPGIDFHHVRVYLYNTDGRLAGMHSPVVEGHLIQSIQDTGRLLTEIQEEKLLIWLKQDLRVLQTGLSGCYIPHHAFVFYNEKNMPLAWMSVCFLCGGIRLYNPENKVKRLEFVSEKAEKKAEAQLKELETLVREAGLIVFQSMEEAEAYCTTKNQQQPAESITITSNQLVERFLMYPLSPDSIKLKLETNKLNYDQRDNIEITAGGTRYYFHIIKYGDSEINFSGKAADALWLSQAVVMDPIPEIIPGIIIGMSLEDAMNLLPVYDGPSEPELMMFQNENGSKKIVLHFKNQRLIKYEVAVLVW